jgi:DUF4097 and DUF4098 domain-containing protein YvlB
MRTFLIFPLLTLLMFTNCQGQKWWNSGIDGTGPRVEKELQLADLNGLKLTLSADVYLTQGNTQSVRVSAQQNIIDLLETKVENGVWKIKTSEQIGKHTPIKIYITVPRMNYVSLSGSGDIFTENTFSNNDKVTIAVSGSGNIRFKTTARQTEVTLSGSGDIDLQGSTGDVAVSISGSGDIDAYNFSAANCQVSISGSGNARVAATEDLHVKVSGSGDVYYRGNPSVTSRISGSGNLTANNNGG